MSLINSGLLPGLILAALPIVLHLVMRAKPKRIEFPALRLIKARRTSNARRMQLRHLLLLLLRCLCIAVLVVAIARPSLPAAAYGLRWWEWTFLAAIIAASVAAYAWLTRQAGIRQVNSSTSQDHRARLRLWCTLGGLLATLLLVGLPWGYRVQAELLSPQNETLQNVPVAAVFLVDTSLSMNYRYESLTRLEHARNVTEEHLGRLPQGSRAAIAGLNPDEEIIFQADLTGAVARLETLVATPVPETLNRRLKAAIQAQLDDRTQTQELTGTGGSADQFAREIYLLTDFSRAGWKDPDDSGLSDVMKTAEWLQVYVIDVGVMNPKNVSLSGLTLSEETSVAGRELQLSMSVNSSPGMSGVTTTETVLINPDGSEAPFGAPQLVNLESGSSRVTMSVKVPGNSRFLEGYVRLTSEDPWKDDNVRYFSCGVRPRPKVLLVSDLPDESQYIRSALQPEELERLGIHYCDCTREVTANIGRQTLSNFDAVFLINCARPDETLWSSLQSFAQNGGGVIVVAGSQRIQSLQWRTTAAAELLPALPIRPIRFLGDPGRLRIEADSHPMLREFVGDDSARVELTSNAFDRCWTVEPGAESVVLLSLDDGRTVHPGLIERKVGRGRSLLFTSAMDNLRDGGSQWNNLPNSWSFVMLIHRMLDHVTGATSHRRNFVAGAPIVVDVPVSQRFEQYLLRRPGLRQTRGTLPADQSSLLINNAVDPGHYRIRPFESASPFEDMFAVNFRDVETDLTRIDDEVIRTMLGPEQVTIVHSIAELQRTVRLGRLGIEIFPVLMGLLVLLICAEHLMSNYFYDTDPQPTAAA